MTRVSSNPTQTCWRGGQAPARRGKELLTAPGSERATSGPPVATLVGDTFESHVRARRGQKACVRHSVLAAGLDVQSHAKRGMAGGRIVEIRHGNLVGGAVPI